MATYQDRPQITFDKKAVNKEAITAFWNEYADGTHSRDFSAHGRASVTYLLTTGRITDEEAAKMHSDLVKCDGEHAAIQEAKKARLEDGDLTLWSNPPKTWLKEHART